MGIDLLLKAVDYCIKLLERREKVLKDRLDRVYKPLFETLETINKNYYEMFFEIQRAFPTPLERGEPSYARSLLACCNKLRELRQEFQSVRDQTSAMASAIELRQDISEPERKFLHEVLRYLPNGELIGGDSPASHGGDRTRSALLLDQLYGSLEDNEVDARALLLSTTHSLRTTWKEVCGAYANLLSEVA